MDDRPVWARRIQSEREARSWTMAEAVRAVRSHGGHSIAGQEVLRRQWKRWESGQIEPGARYKRLIAITFGLATAVIFPPARWDRDGDLLAATGVDTQEIVERLRASDLSQQVIDALEITAEKLSCEYSSTAPEELHIEAQAWLRRLTALRYGHVTLTQHRELLTLAGRVALLAGCLEYDMGRHAPAEATRQAALSLGEESENSDVIGWAHEMRAWYELTRGRFQSAIAAADEGLDKVGPAHSVVVQLAAHRAKAWARIGDRRQVELALDQGRRFLEALPVPNNPKNHFVVDPSKWDFYTMDCYRLVGEDRLAEFYADEVIRSVTNPDGTVRGPMRVAEARVTKGIVAARRGDLGQALAYGRDALRLGRQSLPSLAMHTGELAVVLRRTFGGEHAVGEYLDELRSLTAA